SADTFDPVQEIVDTDGENGVDEDGVDAESLGDEVTDTDSGEDGVIDTDTVQEESEGGEDTTDQSIGDSSKVTDNEELLEEGEANKLEPMDIGLMGSEITDKLHITSVKLTNKAGESIDIKDNPSTRPSIDDPVKIEYKWELEDNHGYLGGS